MLGAFLELKETYEEPHRHGDARLLEPEDSSWASRGQRWQEALRTFETVFPQGYPQLCLKSPKKQRDVLTLLGLPLPPKILSC